MYLLFHGVIRLDSRIVSLVGQLLHASGLSEVLVHLLPEVPGLLEHGIPHLVELVPGRLEVRILEEEISDGGGNTLSHSWI